MPKPSRTEIADYELAAARAWPAERVTTVAGWLLRESGGGSRRANSVLPLSFDGSDVSRAIRSVAAHYHALRLPAYFQVSGICEPTDLDRHLSDAGYLREEPTLLLTKPVVGHAAMPAGVTLSGDWNADWLAVYGADLGEERRAAAPTVLARVPSPRAFFRMEDAATTVATGLGVIVGTTAVVECIATAPNARRNGHGRRVMQALECWAFGAGARTLVLQVTERNAPARRLYEAIGFGETARYHYRVLAL